MATITVSLPTDDSTAEVADYNTPITTIVNAINGGLDSNNLADNAVTTAKITDANVTGAKIGTGSSGVGNANLLTTAGDLGGAWKDWTISWTNLTVGSGTVVSKYMQIGKTIHYRISFVFGAGSAVGNVSFSLPVTAATQNIYTPIGSVSLLDSGTASFQGNVINPTNTTGKVYSLNSAPFAAQTELSATSPFTWTTNDAIVISGTYEAA